MKTFIKKNYWLIGILFVSVAFRVAAAVYMGDKVVDLPGTFDQISYHTLALRIINGHGFTFGETWWPITPAGAPTAHWSFLYTLYLAGVYFLFGPHPLVARLIQAVIVGILHPLLAYLIGKRIFSKTIGLVAAGLTAIYVYFFYYAATLMTEPFYITAILGGIYLTILIAQTSVNKDDKSSLRKIVKLSIYLGLTLGAAVLLRQLLLFIVPVLFLWILWVKRKKYWQSTGISFIITCGIIGLMILPFTIFNASRFHRFVLLNTNSGYAFFWANNPIYGTHFQGILTTTSYQDLIPPELRHLDEAALDQALMKRGIQFVIDDPIRYVLLSISRIPVYFMFWPSKASGTISNISRVASFGIFLPFMLYGLFRAVVDRKMSFSDRLASPPFLLIIVSILYTAIHLLSWALIRYRLPVDALMLIFAALAFVDLAQRIKPVRKLFTSEIQNHS